MSTRIEFLAAGAVSALGLGAAVDVAAAAPAAAATPAPVADAKILDQAAFRARIATGAGVLHRQAIAAARVDDAASLQFAVNTLNGFTNGWHVAPAAVQVAIVLAGSACTIALDDAAWRTYRLADIVRAVKNDFLTVDATEGNPWSRPSATLDPNADRSIPALLKRGVRIFVCNTALGEISNRVVKAGFAAGATDAFAVQAALRLRVLPGCDIVPAGISAVSVLQESGYTYFSAAL
ncbi:MAG: hypothetical protein NVS3B7_02390 [Candidatus Elarobacter sp.]